MDNNISESTKPMAESSEQNSELIEMIREMIRTMGSGRVNEPEQNLDPEFRGNLEIKGHLPVLEIEHETKQDTDASNHSVEEVLARNPIDQKKLLELLAKEFSTEDPRPCSSPDAYLEGRSARDNPYADAEKLLKIVFESMKIASDLPFEGLRQKWESLSPAEREAEYSKIMHSVTDWAKKAIALLPTNDTKSMLLKAALLGAVGCLDSYADDKIEKMKKEGVFASNTPPEHFLFT